MRARRETILRIMVVFIWLGTIFAFLGLLSDPGSVGHLLCNLIVILCNGVGFTLAIILLMT